MRSMDREVLEHISAWVKEGIQPWLFTIVGTVGSSPRPVGSVLAVTDDGRQIGSVSGGCVEEDLLERLRKGQFTGDKPQLTQYGVTPEENERLGLPCGGRITLLLQKLDTPDLHWVESILQALAKRQCIERRLDLATGATTLVDVAQFESLVMDEQTLTQCFGPQMLMILVGAGQLACQLAELAIAMDYEVRVTDPREQFLRQWEGPAVPLLQGMPDDVIRDNADHPLSIVITLTHDPRIDDMALMEALLTDAWYVGALGSARTTQKRLRRLAQLDIPAQNIARLHAPVGLDIGSKTPIEIAVAIMAQITQLRRTEAAPVVELPV
ncbi:MAG: xanthine dehydrogenase accessory factor [Bacteroidia bacterium]|jgi:xanthine dehydrogenase accessory factor